MKTLKSTYLIIIFALSALSLSAQEKLTLQQAITIALENNYDIKLSKNNSEISKNDVTFGNAGMLPMVTGNLVQGNQIQTSNVDLASGITRTAKNAKTTNLNYGANLNWKIFDGFQMFTNYQRLLQLEQLGELNAKLTVQTTIADIIQAYYDLVAQQKQF